MTRRIKPDLPLDGGYSWVIVAACSLLFAISMGGAKCQGMIYLELIERYGDVYKTSSLLWVFTIYPMVSGFSGPLVGMMITRFGLRVVSMAGVTILSFSYITLAFAESLPTMIVLASLPGGLGLRMVILPCMLFVPSYFLKRRALAQGIMAGGCGLGTITIPFILRFFFDTMDYSSAMLVFAGFSLQFVVIAALVRPVDYYKALSPPETESGQLQDDLQSHDSNDNKFDHGKHEYQKSASVDRLNRSRLDLSIGVLFFHSQHVNQPSSDHHSTDDPKPARKASERLLPTTNILSIGDVGGSVAVICKSLPSETTDSEKTSSSVEPTDPCCISYGKVIRNPLFLLLALSMFIFSLGISIVYQCAPGLADESGVPKDTVAHVMMIAGAVEMPSRLINGILVDKHVISATSQQTLCMLIAGSLALVCAIVSGLPGLVMVLLGMSMAGSAFFTLILIMGVELLGVENVAPAMAMQTIAQSLGLIISTFVAGYIYDASGSWRMVFYYIAVSMILGGLVWVPYCLRKSLSTRCRQSSDLNNNSEPESHPADMLDS